MSRFVKKFQDIFTRLFIVGSLLIIFFYSPSIVIEFPFFKVRHIELNVKRPFLKEVVRNLLKKDFHNNWLFLKINYDKLLKKLQKSTSFWVENVSLFSFNPLKGVLNLQLELNKPLFLFNHIYYLAKNGRIFKPPNAKYNYPLLIDSSKEWKIGDSYSKKVISHLMIVSKISPIKVATVQNLKISVKTEKGEYIFPEFSNNFYATAVNITQYFSGRITNLDFFGKKSVAVKIYKE